MHAHTQALGMDAACIILTKYKREQAFVHYRKIYFSDNRGWEF